MLRREFIAGLGSAAAWPVVARAQQGDRMRRIGLLMNGDENDSVQKARLSAFTQALADFGWTDGRNVRVDVRWYGSDINLSRALAQELVGLQPDIIVTSGTPGTVALRRRACPPGATESRTIELQGPIIWTKCHLGGRRPWFKCQNIINGVVCDRRVAKLYAPCFECRRCLGLRYESQREIPLTRAARRAQKIKMRLGGSNDPLEPFPQKPRRMHWRTYRRLRNEAKAAKAEADYLLAESLPGLAQLLDLVPPRQKRQRGRRDGPKPPSAAGSTLTLPLSLRLCRSE